MYTSEKNKSLQSTMTEYRSKILGSIFSLTKVRDNLRNRATLDTMNDLLAINMVMKRLTELDNDAVDFQNELKAQEKIKPTRTTYCEKPY